MFDVRLSAGKEESSSCQQYDLNHCAIIKQLGHMSELSYTLKMNYVGGEMKALCLWASACHFRELKMGWLRKYRSTFNISQKGQNTNRSFLPLPLFLAVHLMHYQANRVLLLWWCIDSGSECLSLLVPNKLNELHMNYPALPPHKAFQLQKWVPISTVHLPAVNSLATNNGNAM